MFDAYFFFFAQEILHDWGLEQKDWSAVQTIVGNVESSATQKEAMLTAADERRRVLLEANAHELAQDMALSEAQHPR